MKISSFGPHHRSNGIALFLEAYPAEAVVKRADAAAVNSRSRERKRRRKSDFLGEGRKWGLCVVWEREKERDRRKTLPLSLAPNLLSPPSLQRHDFMHSEI